MKLFNLPIGDTMAIGNTISVRNRLAVGDSFTIGDRLLSFYWCFVSLDVEVDEQNEVAREKDTSKDSSGLCSSARTEMWEVREVVRRIVGVSYEISKIITSV